MKPDNVVKTSTACADKMARRKAITNSAKETQDEKLARLRDQEMTKLGFKIRQQNTELTTSPRTLALARQTTANQPATEITPPAPTTTTMVVSSPPAKAQRNRAATGPALPNKAVVQTAASHSRQGSGNQSVTTTLFSGRARKKSRFHQKDRPRWATVEETRPPPKPARSLDSNACGSNVPSDAETASGDSIAVLKNGRPARSSRPDVSETQLADYNGDWMPAPVDWSDRPPFSHDSSTFMARFDDWNDVNAAQSLNEATGLPFVRLSRDLVENPDLHPDGLYLVDATMTVDIDTAERYGYVDEDALAAIRQDAHLIDSSMFRADWGKLDLKDAENAKYKDERCGELVRNYNANIAKEQQEEFSLRQAQKLVRRQQPPPSSTSNRHIPRIKIYLRPAVQGDLPQLQDIYNSYVTGTVRTSELHPISYPDMNDRWTASTEEKLPFLVAVSKSAKIHRENGKVVEKILGWASATDWVGRNSVERFTVELEIYVHRSYLHHGVGKCLMDKLVESTDRGHTPRKGYPFNCARELQPAYSIGGTRSLTKLVIMVRSYDKPKHVKENDLPWIKKWLEEEWNFEQQGSMNRVGVKFKRYVNHTYFVRDTAYSPAERFIPEG